MRQHSTNRLWGRLLAWMLAAALMFSNLEGAAFVYAEGENDTPVEIASVQDLQKIGVDADYPMSGDYRLTADIDLSDIEWEPLGGYIGVKGTCDPREANVFSGTFDGQGHVISGLTINLDGSIAQEGKYGQVGLFSVIGSNDANDYAQVKDLIFTDINIRTDFSNGLAAVGTLAGEVNGYAMISGIAVLDGTLTINPSATCDTVGVGGIIGECRTADAIANRNVTVTDCYNGADVFASGSRQDLIYAAGIIGRVAQSACKEISGCINTGIVQYEGYDAFAIAAAQNGTADFLSTLSNCYFPSSLEQLTLGGVTAVKDNELMGGTLPANLSADKWQAVAGYYPVPAICFTSSAAGRIYLSSLVLTFAEGESAAGVTTEIILPQTAGEEAVTWSSSQEQALSIEEGKAVAHPNDIGMDTTVVLTAQTAKGYSRTFKIIVLTNNEQVASFQFAPDSDANYAKVGTPLTVSVSNLPEGMELDYQWSVDKQVIANTSNSYTPTEDDLEKFISVTVSAKDGSLSWQLSTYCSELPVVYVETEDGKGINSNTVAKDATIKIQGNEEFNDSATWYSGATTIKGRGNSTWNEAVSWGVKKPYKLKLAKKANLLGLGKNNKNMSKNTNKHWVLLANMIDHTNMRNELAYDFSKDVGMEVSMGTTNVVLILNDEYQGIYELAEHVRVGSARVDVHEWEGLADDIAEAIAIGICTENTALKLKTVTSDLEDIMEQDYRWVTEKKVVYKGETYQIADYYKDENGQAIAIPEVTGGFLLDMDFRSTSDQYKYISTFSTKYGRIPMFFRAPEYAKTSDVMMDFARNYLDAYEAALRSTDFTTQYGGETVHYTDLFDLDSLLQYWLLCEYVNNWDSMKNSTYLYKDLEGKAKMGPAWDYDWAWGNINMYSMTGPFVYDKWHTTLCGMSTGEGGFAEQGYQREQWNRYLVKDPYFVTKAYEFYKKYRPIVIEDIMKEGGKIDTLQEKYRTASLANDVKWSYSYDRCRGYAFTDENQAPVLTSSQTYDAAVKSLKIFIKKRVQWMDTQVTDVEDFYASLGNQVSSKISVTAEENTTDGTVTATAEVSDAGVDAVTFLVNGRKAEIDGQTVIPLTDGKAVITVDSRLLEAVEGAMNTIEVLGLKGNQYVTGAMNFTNIVTTNVKVPVQLTGEVTVTSSREGNVSYPGDTLCATVSEDTNNTGDFSYQWYAGNTVIAGATGDSYVLTENDIGKAITVKITSSVETQYIQGKYNGSIEREPGEEPDPDDPDPDNPDPDKPDPDNPDPDKPDPDNPDPDKPGPGNPDPDEPAVLTGTATVSSSRSGDVSYPGDTLTVKIAQSNNSGDLSYQWYANGSKIAGATKDAYLLTAADVGKKITVEVTSSVETGKITGSYDGSVIAEPIKATGISLSVKSKKMYAYQTLQLKAAVSPREASQDVEYISSKRAVADVSATGKITAKAPGTARITVRAKDGSGIFAVCTITVQKPVIKISGKTSVKTKKTITLTAKTYGLKGNVKWKLDAKGKKLLKLNKSKGNKVKLTAKKKTGKAKLTITCGKKKVTKTIRVKK